MRYALLVSILLSACAAPGTLLDIPSSAETASAKYYDVFWFSEPTEAERKEQTCDGFEGASGPVAAYVERLPDQQTDDGPQLLPADFPASGAQILISGDLRARVAVALLDANQQLIGVATYPSNIQVSTDANRRYQLTTQPIGAQTGTLPNGEWHAAKVTALGVQRSSVLRFPAADFEYRIAPGRDFDGDGASVASNTTCPTRDNPTTTFDCNDLRDSVKPQPTIKDDTCGRAEPDIDCQFNAKTPELCAAPVGATSCTFGLIACGDGGDGVCTPTQSTILFPAANPFCTSASAVTAVNCVVHRGIACRDPMTQPRIDTRLEVVDAPCRLALLSAPLFPGGRDIEFKNGGMVLNHSGEANLLTQCKIDLRLSSINDQSGYMYVALGLSNSDPRMFKVHFTEDCDPLQALAVTCDPFVF